MLTITMHYTGKLDNGHKFDSRLLHLLVTCKFASDVAV